MPPVDAYTPGSPAELDDHPDLIGPYRILGVLGRGGMGVVFDALAPAADRSYGPGSARVALKVIRPQMIDPEQADILVARFHREAKILQQMNHPSVVRLVDAGEVDGTLYLAMERIEGVSLLSLRRRGPLAFDALVPLGVDLADAIQHLHEAGVVHRDIKPANILIRAHGRPVITDFGISGMNEATGITRMGDLLGSPGFMAPEVTEGAAPTELSDQFALGRLLYELGATGPAKKLPKKAPILEILAASLEIDWNRFPKGKGWGGLEAVLRRMVASEPLERFPSARAVKEALSALIGDDVLDRDTLAEHVERLGVEPRSAWDERSLYPDAPPPGHVPTLVLKEAPRPAGGPREATEPTPPAYAPGLDDPGAAVPPRGALSHAPGRGYAGSEDVTLPPPHPVGLGRGEAPKSAKAWSNTVPQEAAEPGRAAHPSTDDAFAALEARLDQGGRGPADTIPDPIPASVLEQLIDQQVLVRSPSEVPLSHDGRVREVLHELDPQASDEEPVGEEGSELARLGRQNARLREQLVQHARYARPVHPARAWIMLMLVGLLSLGIGVAAGWLLHRPPVLPPIVVLVPPGQGPAIELAVRFAGLSAPSAKDLDDAKGLFANAVEHLAKEDILGAEAFLAQCIQAADLPECHRALGTIFALTRNPAARAHFEHYLRIAPNAPDSDAIRRLLQNP